MDQWDGTAKPLWQVTWHNMPHCYCGHGHTSRMGANKCAGDDKNAYVVAYNASALVADCAQYETPDQLAEKINKLRVENNSLKAWIRHNHPELGEFMQ